MWSSEYRAGTDADPAAIWRLWSDVTTWTGWDGGAEKVEIDGDFAVGSVVTMTPVGQDPLRMRLVEVVEGELFTDETPFDGLVIRVIHRLERAGPGRTTVIYRTEITGDAAEEAGPQVGPAITADFPDTVAALIAQARSRSTQSH
jgi:hypothetical protein